MRTLRTATLVLLIGNPMADAWTQPPAEVSPREVFQAAQGFLAAGSGRWVTPNRHFEPGRPGARWFGLEFEWAPEPHAMAGRIYGIAEDGTRRRFWTMWTVWNPVRGEAVHYQMAGNGTWVEGATTFEGSEVHRVTMEGALADGTPFRFRDELREIGEDRIQTRSTQWKDGGWEEGPVEHWRRVETFDPTTWPEGVGVPEE